MPFGQKKSRYPLKKADTDQIYAILFFFQNRNSVQMSAAASRHASTSAMGAAANAPVNPNLPDKISASGIRKIICLDNATSRDFAGLPIAWKKDAVT